MLTSTRQSILVNIALTIIGATIGFALRPASASAGDERSEIVSELRRIADAIGDGNRNCRR